MTSFAAKKPSPTTPEALQREGSQASATHSSASLNGHTPSSTKPKARNKPLAILVLLLFFLGWLACVASLVVRPSTKMIAYKAACSLGQDCEHFFANIHVLEKPSKKLKQWLCAAKEVQEEKDKAAEEAEQEALVQQWAEAEKASAAMLKKMALTPKTVIGSATGIAGVLGTLYYLGWWPSSVQKAA
mmetsp:Transcript_75126/g.141671  ORF Transcript_75126/g.141671 Transcript_75126/m.141671 type:complete len:187 (-) Transcript_75126:80-640(-)